MTLCRDQAHRHELYVIGAGGHGRELHAYIEDLRRAGWQGELKGFLDDGVPKGLHRGLEVIGPITVLDFLRNGAGRSSLYITAVGSNPLRREIVSRLKDVYGEALTPWTLLHPLAYVGEDVEIGIGSCVAPNAILTASVRIGQHCILNVKASVSHNCTVGDFANINPAATICGWVTIGEGASIGAGAIVKDRISIGAWSLIGAGAVVTRDIPSNVTAVGVPARIIKNTGLLSCPASERH